MRDTRDPTTLGEIILRSVKAGMPVGRAADQAWERLSERPQDGPSEARIVGTPFGYPLDLSGAEAASEGEA